MTSLVCFVTQFEFTVDNVTAANYQNYIVAGGSHVQFSIQFLNMPSLAILLLLSAEYSVNE